MPEAARYTDFHSCPKSEPGPVPHVGGPVLGPKKRSVFIGKLPAAIKGDMCICVGPPDKIKIGSKTVKIMGKPAARKGDMTEHGGKIEIGCPTVIIGG